MGDAGKRRFLGIICVLYTMVILIAGLWPFNFKAVNKAEWVKNENGIDFNGRGIVYNPEPLKLPDTVLKNGSITIEILLRAHQESKTSIPSILTLMDNNRLLFIFCQWNKALLIRVPNNKTERINRYREIGVANAFSKESTHLITVISHIETTAVYIDGKLLRNVPHYSLVTNDNWLRGRIVLGNSPEGISPWNGSILGLAIYDQALTGKDIIDHNRVWQHREQSLLAEKKKPIALYLFDEHDGEHIQDHSGYGNRLLMTKTFRPLKRIILEVPPREYWFTYSNLIDMAVNVLGFIPFGFFLLFWWQQKGQFSAPLGYDITILLGCSLSLTIELTQAYLPTRDSSLLDVLDNVFGTVLGTLLRRHSIQILNWFKPAR